ncbi:MAG: type IV-A pilus assembly ATPase PilB, partial [Methylococcales bacterium]
MVIAANKINLQGLAKGLVQMGLLNEADARNHIEEAQKKNIPLTTYLVTNHILHSREIAIHASKKFGIPLFDLDALSTDSSLSRLVSEKLITQHHALPLFKRGNRLFIGLADPTNGRALDEIKFHTRANTETILVEESKLSKAIARALEAQDTRMADLLDQDPDNPPVRGGADGGSSAIDLDADIDDAPIVRFVNKILLDSIKKGASDIHLEPYEKFFRIRFRNDGMLHEIARPPASLATRIISRIKVMSRMDIAERRVPQDGRIKMALSRTRAIDFRVSSCPTLFGEKVVLRLLDPSSTQIGIEQLGFEERQQNLFLEAIHKPYGMILVTGPTGSGKTVSLYTGLNILNTGDKNISTAEDPVEITIPGINQVNMNPKAGMTFAVALRAFLRQDPDIIMVGEIRDRETADIAVKAAQTGHLVLSTLHTNDAPQTLNRLVQMGVPAYNIASSVLLIMAQRLARRLCEFCKKKVHLPNDILLQAGFKEAELSGLTLYEATGCEHCVK